jgi:hypothetical protein
MGLKRDSTEVMVTSEKSNMLSSFIVSLYNEYNNNLWSLYLIIIKYPLLQVLNQAYIVCDYQN